MPQTWRLSFDSSVKAQFGSISEFRHYIRLRTQGSRERIELQRRDTLDSRDRRAKNTDQLHKLQNDMYGTATPCHNHALASTETSTADCSDTFSSSICGSFKVKISKNASEPSGACETLPMRNRLLSQKYDDVASASICM